MDVQAQARLRELTPFITLVVMVLVVGAFAPGFLAPSTLIVLAGDTATLFIMAAGVTFVIMLGGIDLSIQAVASLASVVMALALPQLGWLAFPVAIAAGLLMGLIGGVAHTKLRIPSFIATLAVSGIAAAAALVISGTRSVPIAAAEREAYLGWITSRALGIPAEVVIGAVVLTGCLLVERYTLFGRYSKAIGAGEAAAIASGIRVDRQKIVACLISAGLAAFSGVILGGRLSSGSPTLANEFLLPAIAAVIVGGTALTGGVGSVWRTLIGALIISVVRIGMTFARVDVFAQQIVFGLVLVAAVAITIDRRKIPIIK
jgi:ribose transport system permease protein